MGIRRAYYGPFLVERVCAACVPSSIGSETPVSQALKYSPNEDMGTRGQSVFNVTWLLSYHGWNSH